MGPMPQLHGMNKGHSLQTQCVEVRMLQKQLHIWNTGGPQT
jgi:hypothetical protein